jgi:hypothetical protein
MRHVAALYPGLFEMGCEMAREGVTRDAARGIAEEACAAAAEAMGADPSAFAAEDALERRMKREVRSRVLATHRPPRHGGERVKGRGAPCRLPVFGWITDPAAPLVSWDMDYAMDDTVFAMPKLRRDTLIRVREDAFTFAAVAEERGPSVEGVARNLAEALADLRAVLRDGRPRPEGSDWTSDPDLVLFGRWLACELSAPEELAAEERFCGDDAFYAKTAPVLQIWTLPTGLFGADDVEEQGLARVDRDTCLISDYLGGELPERDRLAVDRLLATDVVFYAKVRPVIDIWEMPLRSFAERAQEKDGTPEPAARETAIPKQQADEDLGDPDLMVLAQWLHRRLPAHHEKAVEMRLVEDEEFFEKVWPVLRVWRTRHGLLRHLGKEIGEEPDAADPDVRLVADYLAMKLPRAESAEIEARLREDETFARKVAPVLKKWRIPRRVSVLSEVA